MLGGAVTWNISNVGAIGGVASASDGVSLAAVGLLTTALFVTHFAAQIPGGRLIDRIGLTFGLPGEDGLSFRVIRLL